MATNISMPQNTTHIGGTTTKVVPVSSFLSSIMDRATSGGGTNGGEITKVSNGVILRTVNTIPIMNNGSNGLGNIQVLTKRIKGANGTSSGLLLNGTQIQLKGSTGAIAGGGNLLIFKTTGSTSGNGENKMKTVIMKTATAGQQKFEPVIICSTSKFNSIGTKHMSSMPVTLVNKKIKLDVKPEGVVKNGESKTLVINAKKEVTVKDTVTSNSTHIVPPVKETVTKVEEVPKKKHYYMLPEKIFDTDDEDEEDEWFCNQENLFNHFNTSKLLHRLRSSGVTLKPSPTGTMPSGIGYKPPAISLSPVIKKEEEEEESSIVEVTPSFASPEPIITTKIAPTNHAIITSTTSLLPNHIERNVMPIQQAKLPETIKIPLVPPSSQITTLKAAAQITMKNGVVNSVPSTVILNGGVKSTPTVVLTSGTLKPESTILLSQPIKAKKSTSAGGELFKSQDASPTDSSLSNSSNNNNSSNSNKKGSSKKKTSTSPPMVSIVKKKKKELPVQKRRRQIWQKLLKELTSRREKVMNTGLERRARSKMLATQCRNWQSTHRLSPVCTPLMSSNIFFKETSILTTTVTVQSVPKVTSGSLLLRSNK